MLGEIEESAEQFKKLLRDAIWNIKQKTRKDIGVIQDEIGYALGFDNGGARFDSWRRGHLPREMVIRIRLARELTLRGGLDGPELKLFLLSLGYPPDGIELSVDGDLIGSKENIQRPSEEFVSHFLEILETPGGAVKLRDQLYIERIADEELRDQVSKRGTTTTIRAPRQTGKTSLLIRGLRHARERRFKDIQLNLQGVNHHTLASIDSFLLYLANYISTKLGHDTYDQIDNIWQSRLTPNDKLTQFFEDCVLEVSEIPIVLAIDEADQLLYEDYSEDFFGLLRSWHDRRATDERWDRFNLVLVISTEPSLLISDSRQSPFNIGFRLSLNDFDEAQVKDLSARHGSPIGDTQIPQLMSLLGGHPYLTRLILYILVTKAWSWDQLNSIDITGLEPVSEHLRHQYNLLQNEPKLKLALKEIISHGRCADQQSFSRLLRAGLVKGSETDCRCRCELYRWYFEGKL